MVNKKVSNKGMNKNLVIGIVVVLLLIGVFWYFNNQKEDGLSPPMYEEEDWGGGDDVAREDEIAVGLPYKCVVKPGKKDVPGVSEICAAANNEPFNRREGINIESKCKMGPLRQEFCVYKKVI